MSSEVADTPSARLGEAGEQPASPDELRYRNIFEAAGVSIWEQDYSQVGAALEALRGRGVTDLRAYLAAHPEFVQKADGLVKVVDINQATLRLLGARDKAAVVASRRDLLLPEAEIVFAQVLLAIWERRSLFEAETTLRTLSGDRRDVMFSVAFPEAPGSLARVLVTLTDISARKQAEMKLRRSEQSLRTLYELTSAVSRARSLEDVYALALNVLIGVVGADRAAVLLFDADGIMRFVASRGLTESYRAAVEGHSPWAPDERSPVPVTIPDVGADASLGALQQTIKAEGIGALAFIPLSDGGRLLGKFMVYFDQPHDFTDDEIHLAENFASQVAHAIRRRRDEAALRESLAIVQIVNEGTPTLLYAKDRDGRMRMANPATLRALGVTLEQALGHTALEYWSDKVAAAQVMANDRELMERGKAVAFEETILLADGAHTFLSTKTPQRDAAGHVIGLVGASIDITDIKRSEERQKLLIRELNHRVKNTLATVQSIAAQTLRGAEGDREARRTFEARLLALSNAHNVLTRESWDGAAIEEIVATALAPHRAAGDSRFAVCGPALRLNPKAALALALALHELTTNAAKYGALSQRAGRVRVEWGIAADGPAPRFCLRWIETDGPAVAPPPRKGFGSRLIERGLSLELGGRAAIDFRPEGIVYSIDAPLVHLAWNAGSAPG